MVSPVGVGLAALGRPAYINIGRAEDFGSDRSVAQFERRCHQMLDAAYESGILYVDAARSYGPCRIISGQLALQTNTSDRRSDRRIEVGVFLRRRMANGRTRPRAEGPLCESLEEQIDESRAILGDYLKLYQIHSATLESGVLDDTEVLSALAALREDGLAIGLTVSGPRQTDVIRRALSILIDGVRLFQVVQATWNLLDPSAGPALAEAKALGCGVIIKEVLANGRLTNRLAQSIGHTKSIHPPNAICRSSISSSIHVPS
jgi:aryl-alcohol dehydrogenase-like predicted oxidoreductase